ncbi:MAG: CesT family type III secretion system chaperone [Puniceicoccales bacterium]|nr:CesT family type III secretion system chaperone [Puniceicoccales bacterium]
MMLQAIAYNRMLNSYLQAAGSRVGAKLFLDENGLCVLRKDEMNQEYVVELPKDSAVVYFYAPICRVPYECSEDFFEKILELNLCGVEYNQATFGLDAKTQNIVLSYTRSMEALDEVAFTNILCNFVRTADRAKRDLTQLTNTLIEQVSLTKSDVEAEMHAHNLTIKVDKLRV